MTKILLMLVTVLGANLLADAILLWALAKGRTIYSPPIVTLIGMAVVVALLYPLYRYLDRWTTMFSKTLLKTGRKFLGRTIGLVVVFLLILLVLYYGYAKLWFGVNTFSVLFGNIV